MTHIPAVSSCIRASLFALAVSVPLSLCAQQGPGGGRDYFVGPKTPPSESFKDFVGRGTAQPNGQHTGRGIPMSGCAAEPLTWTVNGVTCNGSASTTTSGFSATVSDTTLPSTGVASFDCLNGNFREAPGSTCKLPDCNAGTSLSWSEAGHTCTGTAPSTVPHNGTGSFTDSTDPDVGSATATCNAGNWQVNPGARCGTACQAGQTLNWTSGGLSCSGTSSYSVNGGAINVSATGTNRGAANFSCVQGTYNFTSGTCSPPVCSGQNVIWGSGGRSCEAAVPDTPSGGTVNVTDTTSPIKGTARYVCNGTSFVLQSGSSCVADCSPQYASWSAGGYSCGASVSTVGHGSGASVPSTNGNQGNGTFTCNDGTLSYTGSGTCAPPASPCASTTLYWGSSCYGSAPSSGSGASISVASSNPSYSGNAQFSCNNGTYSLTSGTCDPINNGCAGGDVGWNVSGVYCSGPLASMTNGQFASATSNNGNSGSAEYVCNSGTLYPTGNQSCAPSSNGCRPQTASWLQCSGTSGGFVNQGAMTSVASSNGYTGDGLFTCNNGVLNWTGNGNCNPPSGGGNCPAQTLPWTVGGLTCSGSVAATQNGFSANVNSSNGNSGSASFSCSNGSFTYLNNGTCSGGSPSPASCNGTTVAWTNPAGTVNCSGFANTTPHNSTVSVSSSSGNAGTASYTCNNGAFSSTGNATCSAASTDCNAQPVSWNASGVTCSGGAPATASGSSVVVNSTSSNTGQATMTCNNGSFSASSASCRAPVKCYALGDPPKIVTWSQGSMVCSGLVGPPVDNTIVVNDGDVIQRVDSTSMIRSGGSGQYTQTNALPMFTYDPTDFTGGSAYFTCVNGTLVADPNSSSCGPTGNFGCDPYPLDWQVGSRVCSSNLPGNSRSANYGESFNVNDASGRGSVTFTCRNGTFFPSNAVCN